MCKTPTNKYYLFFIICDEKKSLKEALIFNLNIQDFGNSLIASIWMVLQQKILEPCQVLYFLLSISDYASSRYELYSTVVQYFLQINKQLAAVLFSVASIISSAILPSCIGSGVQLVTISRIGNMVLLWCWRAIVIFCYKVAQEHYKYTNSSNSNKHSVTDSSSLYIMCAVKKCLNAAKVSIPDIRNIVFRFIASTKMFLQQLDQEFCKMHYFNYQNFLLILQ